MIRNRWKLIGYSWLAMKTWVKIWLFWLNLVLLNSVFFLDEPLGQYTLLSLPPTIMLLVLIAYRYSGLVRLLGIGHLIPWIPLLTYAELRLLTNWVGSKILFINSPYLFLWAVALVISLTICLVFDVFDIIRWYRGERYVLGTKAAFLAGASKLSRHLESH
jgi:hypothetical protein